MRCRNHSRATKIGHRTWKRNELCSNGRAVPLAHQELDQPDVGVGELGHPPAEADPRRVDDGEVVGHHAVEPHETVVQHGDAPVRQHFWHDRHGDEGNRGVCRSIGLLLPELEARFLPRRREAARVPPPLRGASPVRRAEHDGLPPARRGALRALGRRDAGGLSVRGQAARPLHAAARRVPGARRAPRRAARPDPRRRPAGSRPGVPRAPLRLARPRAPRSPSTSTTSRGTASTSRPASA